jgi:hypothetical protein
MTLSGGVRFQLAKLRLGKLEAYPTFAERKATILATT